MAKEEIIKNQLKEWEGQKRYGRQHVIHKRISDDESLRNWDNVKILCGVKKFCCVNEKWDNVECVFCLKKGLKQLNSEKQGKTCATKHDIPPKSKDSGILPNFT